MCPSSATEAPADGEQHSLLKRIKTYAASFSINNLPKSSSETSLSSSSSEEANDRHHARHKSAIHTVVERRGRLQRAFSTPAAQISSRPLFAQSDAFLLDSFDCVLLHSDDGESYRLIQGRLYLCQAFLLFSAKQWGRITARIRLPLASITLAIPHNVERPFRCQGIEVATKEQRSFVFVNFRQAKRALDAIQDQLRANQSVSEPAVEAMASESTFATVVYEATPREVFERIKEAGIACTPIRESPDTIAFSDESWTARLELFGDSWNCRVAIHGREYEKLKDFIYSIEGVERKPSALRVIVTYCIFALYEYIWRRRHHFKWPLITALAISIALCYLCQPNPPLSKRELLLLRLVRLRRKK